MANQEQRVEVIPIYTINYRASADAPEEIYAGGADAKPAKLPASEAKRLVEAGAAKYPDSDEEEQPEKPLTRAELEAAAKELGIDVKSIEGTGAKGAVKVSDIEAAIAAKQAENAGGAGNNPSVVG